MRSALATALSITALAAAGATPAATSPTGVRGLLLRGPIRPVCTVTEPCEAPARGYTLVFSRAGKVVARTLTGADGRFRIALRPGRYGVRTSRTGFERYVQPATVIVPTDRWARVTLRIDTGIR